MAYETLLVTTEKNICIITINRPDKLNALNKTVFDELEQAVDALDKDDNLKAAIITGAGEKAFVAGADIKEFSTFTKEQAEKLSKRGQDVFFKIENHRKPIIAAVNGFALGGGCELAMSCHFRICSDNAKFGQPEVNLGLIAGYGGTQRLTQLVGKGKSMELHLSGGLLNAQEALQWGLVNYVTSKEELMPKAIEILSVITSKAPIALQYVIQTVNASANGVGLPGFAQETSAFGACFETEDMKEGVGAFLEKRAAVFSGK
jgi:enoyl-CoA hydratase